MIVDISISAISIIARAVPAPGSIRLRGPNSRSAVSANAGNDPFCNPIREVKPLLRACRMSGCRGSGNTWTTQLQFGLSVLPCVVCRICDRGDESILYANG